MRAGFTGTQVGATKAQRRTLKNLLVNLGVTELHHGDCVGADAMAHMVARELGGIKVVGHPPTITTKRAYCEVDEEREPLPYLHRNSAIVEETEVLVAVPRILTEEVRSGTWSTIRRARKARRTIYLIGPTGRLEIEEPPPAAEDMN